MPVPQFNKNKTTDSWYLLTYQSNDELNEATHNQIKIMISEILVKEIKIKDIHSYIHGTVVFSLSSNPLIKFDDIIRELNTPLTTHPKRLLYSLVLVGKDAIEPPSRYMYIVGSDEMEARFKLSIKGFYPPEAPTNKSNFSIK